MNIRKRTRRIGRPRKNHEGYPGDVLMHHHPQVSGMEEDYARARSMLPWVRAALFLSVGYLIAKSVLGKKGGK